MNKNGMPSPYSPKGIFSFAREKYREVLVAHLYRTSRHVFEVDKHESWSLYPLSFPGTVIIFGSIHIVVMYHFRGFFIIESPTSKISLWKQRWRSWFVECKGNLLYPPWHLQWKKFVISQTRQWTTCTYFTISDYWANNKGIIEREWKEENNYYITSAPSIVAYEPELKSPTLTSLVLALTVKSFPRDKANLNAQAKACKFLKQYVKIQKQNNIKIKIEGRKTCNKNYE